MNTIVQVKRFVKPLLEQYDDLELIGRYLIIKPVRHVVRAICFETGKYAESCWPERRLGHLTSQFGWNGGWDWFSCIKNPLGIVWQWPNAVAMDMLLQKIEHEEIVQFRLQDNLLAFLPSINRPPPGLKPPYWQFMNAIPYYVSIGDIDSAKNIISQKPNLLDHEFIKSKIPLTGNISNKIENHLNLCRLLASDDRKGMAALLHEFEAISVKEMNLEHLWEPTPFPLELMG